MAKKNTDQKWTAEEVELLYKFAAVKNDEEIRELIPTHSLIGIRSKIKRLKIRFSSPKWTNEELDLLKKNCNENITVLEKMFPNRSKKAIFKTMARYSIGERRTRNEWTEEEIEIIKNNGDSLFSTELAQSIVRHTEASISAKCFILGVKKSDECRSRQAKIAQTFRTEESLFKLDQKFTLDDLDYDTVQVLIGSLLGDGCCNPRPGDKNFIFTESHSWTQKDYVLWKIEKLKVFLPSYMESHVPTLYTSTHSIFHSLRRKIYEDKRTKNKIPTEIVEKIDYLALLVWYLDDGYLGRPKSGLKTNGTLRNSYPHITCKGYDLKDLYNLCNILNEKFNSDFYVKTTKHKAGLNKQIILNKDKDRLFPIWKDIAKKLQLPECMAYKLEVGNG